MAVRRGATLLLLLVVLSVLAIGLLVAVPVWRTEIQREKEAELIFRGRQVVEAVRLFQARLPGRYPRSLEELVETRCLRRPYKDPMTPSGEWQIILLPGDAAPGSAGGGQRVLVVPRKLLASVQSPRLIGVVSSSTKKSFKVYEKATSYDQWLFFYGRDPDRRPEIVRLGQEEKPT